MLKGTRTAIIRKIQPISIHGQISLDVFWMDPEDIEEEIRHCRVGSKSRHRGGKTKRARIAPGPVSLPMDARVQARVPLRRARTP